MKAGAIGPCPSLNTEQLSTMMILSENKFAVLLDENYFSEFEEKVNQDSNIETVFIVTDYEAGYRIVCIENKLHKYVCCFLKTGGIYENSVCIRLRWNIVTK